jgi:YggT family protein
MVFAANPVLRLICLALRIFWGILFVRVVVSWIQGFGGWRPPATGIVRSGYELLFDVTEPVLRPLRRIVPPAGPLDLSVIVAFVIILVAQSAWC